MTTIRPLSEPPRVLIVDDDDEAAWSLAKLLHLTLNCQVATATDGAEALDKVTELRPEVVVMDIRMPGLDGMEAAKFMHRLVPAGNMPLLIALTGLDSEADRRRIKDCGFHAHLVKPVHFEQLLALLTSRAKVPG